jgi:hypothetical protein
MSWSNLITCSTNVEGAIPFEVSWVATLETLILRTSVVPTIGSSMGIVRSSRWTGKRNGGGHNSNSLELPNSLTEVGPSNDSNMAFDFLTNH